MSKTILRDWLASKKLSVASLAEFLGKPQKTIEDWVYGRANPSVDNRLLLFLMTELSTYGPRNTAEEQRLAEVNSGLEKLINERIGEFIRLLAQLQDALGFFEFVPQRDRDKLRGRLDPQRIALLANFLRAMLSEERLDGWRVSQDVSRRLARGGARHGRNQT